MMRMRRRRMRKMGLCCLTASGTNDEHKLAVGSHRTGKILLICLWLNCVSLCACVFAILIFVKCVLACMYVSVCVCARTYKAVGVHLLVFAFCPIGFLFAHGGVISKGSALCLSLEQLFDFINYWPAGADVVWHNLAFQPLTAFCHCSTLHYLFIALAW